jgi:hypothetical protein
VIIGNEGFDSVRVQVVGTQFSNGEMERSVEFAVEGGDEPDDYSIRRLDPTLARSIAHMLLVAANEIDAESDPAPIGVADDVSALKARLEAWRDRKNV